MRALLWSNQDPWHTEMAFVELADGGLTAQGVQLRTAPEPLRLDYRLDARDGFATTELALSCTVEGTVRELVLRRERDGWATAAGPVPGLEQALDVDILDSPLTNTMPVRRHGLGDGGSVDLTVAFVRVPELAVVVSRQRYEHLEHHEAGSLVRYTSLDSGFTADLELDGYGFVVDYPGLARRLAT